jgi:hypothetical protein
MKNLKKILQIWMDAWESSNRKVTFPRVACDAIRKAGGSTLELQNYISQAMATPEDKRNKSMRDALVQYLTIKKECEMAIAEDAADSNQGAIFLLKATHGYEDKQTVRVEDGNLADVIAKKSQHKDD